MGLAASEVASWWAVLLGALPRKDFKLSLLGVECLHSCVSLLQVARRNWGPSVSLATSLEVLLHRLHSLSKLHRWRASDRTTTELRVFVSHLMIVDFTVWLTQHSIGLRIAWEKQRRDLMRFLPRSCKGIRRSAHHPLLCRLPALLLEAHQLLKRTHAVRGCRILVLEHLGLLLDPFTTTGHVAGFRLFLGSNRPRSFWQFVQSCFVS